MNDVQLQMNTRVFETNCLLILREKIQLQLHKEENITFLATVSSSCCSVCVVDSRIPVPVSGSGHFEMRRQSSELFLDGALSPPCQRMGAMVAFQCFDDFKRSDSRQSTLSVVFMDDGAFSWCLLVAFSCRNFDEVLCSFAEPLSESALFSDSCSGLYDEENFKVSLSICQCFG